MLNLKVKTLSYYLGCFLYTHTHTQDLIVSLIFYNISIAIVNHLTTDIQYIQWHQLILILIVNIYLQLFDHGLKRSVKVYNTYFTFKVTTFEQWLTSVCYGRPLLQNTISSCVAISTCQACIHNSPTHYKFQSTANKNRLSDKT